jgi:hypothetical protein
MKGKKERKKTASGPAPQASPYRNMDTPRGWRRTVHGALVYRVYPDGGFEVVGKIQDPDRLTDELAELAEGLLQERELLRQKRIRRRGGTKAPADPQTVELFEAPAGNAGAAVRLENIPPLTGK